jgi:hypothetical protein
MPKTIVRVSINFTYDEWAQGREFLSAIGRQDLARAPQNPFGYTMKLEGEEEFLQFKAVAELFDFSRRIGVGREYRYSARELKAASLLSVRYTRKAHGIGGPEAGTQYDFDAACPCCGTGALQTSELLVKGRLPEQLDLIRIETGEWLVSQTLAYALGERTSGSELRPVKSAKNGHLLPWIQLLPRVTLPPVGAKTRGIEISEQCVCCLRDGHFGTTAEPFELHYGPQACELAADAMVTWEHFGLSRLRMPRSDTVLARPMLVISSRLFRELQTQKVRGLAFTPVICDDA